MLLRERLNLHDEAHEDAKAFWRDLCDLIQYLDLDEKGQEALINCPKLVRKLCMEKYCVLKILFGLSTTAHRALFSLKHLRPLNDECIKLLTEEGKPLKSQMSP
jgi:hypothetical protein